jgi:hypothetical protein
VPQLSTISPGQSATFEILTGIDVINDPGEITAVKYHPGF